MTTETQKPAPKKGSPEAIAAGMIRNRRPAEHVPSILDAPDEAPVLHRNLPIGLIHPSPFQRRTKIDPDHVKSLAKSIEKDGLLQDILVRELPNGSYELVAGENRLEAHKLLGRETVSARIRGMTDGEAARALTADNIQRKNFTDFETFLHFKMLHDDGFVTTDEDMAELIGKDRSYVSKMWAFKDFPEAAIEALKEHPGAIGSELASKLRSTGLAQAEPDLVAKAIQEVGEKRLKQAGAVSWIKQQQKEREGKEKDTALISDKQFLHKKKKVRVVVKEGSFQVSAKGLKGADIEALFMSRIEDLIA